MLKFRNILIILGIFFLLKFIGQIMKAKRQAEAKNKNDRQMEKIRRQKEFVQKNKGKTFVIPKDTSVNDVEDVDYQDVK